MLEHGGGVIINTASTAGLHGGAAGAAYTVAKHRLVGLTRQHGMDVCQAGHSLQCHLPRRFTMTHIGESMPEDRLDPTGAARAAEFAALAPVYLQPDDIAALALFLASDESRHINGAIIPADGGWDAV
ncbi:MAG: SDR family oxidoreductase [Caldilineaceae bacterium]